MNPAAVYQHINFVPDWYVAQRQRRASVRRQTMLIAIMLVGMGTLFGLTRQKVVDLQHYHQTLDTQLNAAEFQLTEVAKLQHARAALSEQLKIYHEIARPLTYGQVIATIAALTPEPVFLVGIAGETKKTEKRRVIPGGGENGRDKTVVDTTETVEVKLEGVAPSNVEIANYIGRLAGSNLFRNVKMEYSRAGQVGKALTREFRVTMEVPLDRPYIFETPEEVADARR